MTLRNILFALSALVLVWTGVGAIMSVTAKHTSTPEKVQALMNTASLVNGSSSDAERKKRLDEIIANVNRLDFDQRRQMHENDRDGGQRYMESLTKDERGRFVNETVEQHFKSVMKAFNQMSREERKNLVNKSLKDMERQEPDGRNMEKLKTEDKQVFDTVVEKGLGAYYNDASAETKLDLAPLMEQMQQRMHDFQHH